MLFDHSQLARTPEDLKEKPEMVQDLVDHEFIIGSAGRTLKELIPGIETGKLYHTLSHGNWSFNHMIAHVLSITGAADVYLTSWTISEQPVKEILRLLDGGVIKDLTCVLDSRVPKQCPNAYQIAQHRFAKLRLCHIHAKLAVVINDDYHITINSSGNLSRNDAIEAYALVESESIARAHAGWITAVYEKSNPFEK